MKRLEDSQAERPINPHLKQKADFIASIGEIESRLVDETRMLEAATRKLETAQFWVNAFGPKGIKAFIIETILPEFNLLVNTHLNALADGLSVEIKAMTVHKKGTSSERMSIDVMNSRGADVYHGNSGGERRRIDLAVLLALQELVSRRATRPLNLAVFDEILGSLDEEGITRALDHLRIRAKKIPTFIIEHNSLAVGSVDDVVEVVKSV